MKKLGFIALLGLGLVLTASCVKDEGYDNTPLGNFDALWHTIDERYCFFEYKQHEYGLDWKTVLREYRSLCTNTMSEDGLFEVLCRMLSELRDGHVNLYSTADVGRNWSFHEDYPHNYNQEVIDSYLGTDYKIAGGMDYKILENNVGYIRYEDFSGSVSDGYLNAVLSEFLMCNGLIIDVRDNGGGVIDYEISFASRFTNEKVFVGYIYHKTGPGHNEFSKGYERWIEPAMDQLRWQKPVAVLTNRGCYSATNTFVSDMKLMPQVRVFGDRTGGGGGVPLSTELPNGWAVRYSASPMTDADDCQIEFGVDPDVFVELSQEDINRGVDTMIEAASAWINSQLQ